MEVLLMKNSFRFAAFVLALTAVCGLATAQFEVNGPNASMTMQGQVPSAADPAAHNINVATPGNFVLNIDSGVNPLQGIIMLASLSELTGPQFPTPLWGGSVDVGDSTLGATSVLIIADGIGFTVNPFIDAYFRTDAASVILPTNDFLLAYSVNQFFCGGRNAWQAIVQEPANAPIFIDNTEAGDANYTSGQALVLLTGDDGTVNVPMLGGNTFSFHGVTYSDIWVNGNGYANFGGFTTVNAAGFVIDTVSFLNAEPAIAICTTDWGIGNTGANDGIYYEESVDTVNGGSTMLISWGDTRAIASGAPGMAHFADVDTNNQIEMILSGDVDPIANPCGFPAAGTSGNFSLRWPRLDVTAFTRPGDGAFGHTPGGAALLGLQASTDMLGQVTATGTGVAGIEEHDNNATNTTVLGWDGAGSARAYNSFFAATGMQVDYIASTAVVPGDLGYVSVPSGTVPDDVEGLLSGATTAGGNLTITGKFFGFGAGTVDITDSSATTFTGLTGTVLSGTGPLFASEGLDVAYPPLASGPATATVNFGSGYVETISFNVLSPCQTVQTFTLGDDAFQAVALTSPVTHYGVVYNTIFVCSNGTVNMTAGHGDFSSTLAEFFGGNNTPGNSNFGLAYCDLNSGGIGSGATYDVIEDSCTGEVVVNFNNQNWWNSIAPAGNFSLTLNWGGVADQSLFNFTQMIDDAGAADNAIIGVGDGVTGGSDTDLSTLGGIEFNIPGYASGVGPDSFAEAMPTGTVATRLNTIVGANGAGTFAVINSGVTGILVAF